MIKTRDLVVFLGVLLFLLCAIVVTLMKENRTEDLVFTLTSLPSQQEGETYGAFGEKRELNRDSIISRLRDMLASNKPKIEPSPSVEENEESVSEEDISATTPGVTYCSNYDDSQAVVRSWPLNGISIVVENNVRKVIHVQELSQNSLATSSSSSTEPTNTQKRTLIQFPASAVVLGDMCVPGEVIGITTTGSLMYNSEVAFYKGYGADYLIGYARDGFPIYGYYEGEVDSCGGYMHPSGYRYTITPNGTYVLGCFKSAPSPFLGF